MKVAESFPRTSEEYVNGKGPVVEDKGKRQRVKMITSTSQIGNCPLIRSQLVINRHKPDPYRILIVL